MQYEKFKELLDKYLDETLLPGEARELAGYLQNPEYKSWFDQHMDHELATRIYELQPDAAIHQDIKAYLSQQIESMPHGRARIISIKKWGWAAAAVTILAVGYLFYTQADRTQEQAPTVATTDTLPAGIKPGGNRAMLILGNGQQIALDEAANGRLATDGGVDINKTGSGEIVYQTEKSSQKLAATEYNTISTPKSGQYALTLDDGTKVWLNAVSSMTFPTAFNGQQRIVRLTGEAFFEVAKDKTRPFIVEVNNTKVEVLGTAFNINSYADENSIKTTLVEGKVAVSKGSQTSLLAPGQQAVVTETIDVLKQVDVEQVVAWKNGLFNFDNANIPELMRQLERWYDISVKFEGTYPSVKFKGKMYRNENLSTVLRFLAEYGVRSRIEGKTLFLQGKN